MSDDKPDSIASKYTLEHVTADGKVARLNMADVIEAGKQLQAEDKAAALSAAIDALTAASEPGVDADGNPTDPERALKPNYPMGDTDTGKRAIAARVAYDAAMLANPAMPVDPAIRAEVEASHDALAKLLAQNHVDDNRSRDESYDEALLAQGYTWKQIALGYRKRAEAYRLDGVTYATRARNMQNGVHATLAPLQMSTKLHREISRQVVQATQVKDTDPGLARLMWDEIVRKLHQVNEDASFIADVKAYVAAEFPEVSLLEGVDVPLTSEQRVGNYHGE